MSVFDVFQSGDVEGGGATKVIKSKGKTTTKQSATASE